MSAEGGSGSVDQSLQGPKGPSHQSNPAHAEATRGSARAALRTWFGFELLVLVWALAVTFGLWLAGVPWLGGRGPNPGAAFSDGLWHLATTALLAASVRDRRVLWVAPLYGLGFDLDHLPGILGAAVVIRPDHSFLFVVAAGVALARKAGRPTALVAAGAVLSHLGLDGGSFPLLAPASAAMYPLPFPAQVVLIGVGAVLMFLAVRPLADIRRPTRILPVALAVSILALLVYFVWPVLGIFTRN